MASLCEYVTMKVIRRILNRLKIKQAVLLDSPSPSFIENEQLHDSSIEIWLREMRIK